MFRQLGCRKGATLAEVAVELRRHAVAEVRDLLVLLLMMTTTTMTMTLNDDDDDNDDQDEDAR